ncbi:MAG TPA: TetR family transcriptional regulator [Kofleriaceae bacterium]|nr:TetR family transcriptional regulator [Kofleriaceae bacterium]
MRAALVKATLRAVAEAGPEGFTLRDVTRRAGVSPAAAYRHFQDKDELLAAVAGECADRLAQAIEASLAEATDDPLDRFRHTGIAVVQFAAAHPEHFRALYVPGMAERMPADQRARRDAWNREQRRELAEAQAAGIIADMPLDDLILAASALVHGLCHMIVEGLLGDVDAARAKQLAIAVTGAIGAGFVPRERKPADRLKR